MSPAARRALVAAMLAAACTRPPAGSPAWQARADAAVAAGDPVAALGVYATAESARLEADLAASRLLLGHQKIGWALQLLRRLEQEHPQEPAVLELHYRTAVANRLFDEGRASAERLLAAVGPRADLLRHLGVLELGARRAEQAVAHLEAASRLAPGAPATWYALGRALEEAQRDGDALAAYQRLLELSPRDVEARWRVARLLARAGRTREALALLDDGGGERNPPRVLYLLATLKAAAGEAAAAQRLLAAHSRAAHAEEQRANARLRYNVQLEEALVRLEAGEPDAAEATLAGLAREAAALRDERVALLSAEVELRRGSAARALAALAPAVQGRPQGWRYRYLVAEVLLALGLRERALEQLDVALRLQPLALEARRLRLHALGEEREGERAAEAERVRILELYALPWERERAGDAGPALAGEARGEFLWDVIQMHPLARLPEESPVPMD